MSSNTSALFHGLVITLLVFASGTCGQARPASLLDNQVHTFIDKIRMDFWLNNRPLSFHSPHLTQESVVDLEPYPTYYSGGVSGGGGNSMVADAMDAVDMMDMEQQQQQQRQVVAPPPMPVLSRSQLQRLLRSSLLMSQPSADALAFLAANNAQATYAKTHGPNHLIQNGGVGGGSMPLYGARLLRMQMSAMPEMKRTARGRSMQCYFNPISCY